MGLKQVTATPTVQAVAAVLLAAIAAVGGASVRGAIGAGTSSYVDPTTRHGEIAVRVDAGGADVTALAAVEPGTPTQVLTVGDDGVPVWRAPASGSVTSAQISDSTTTGRAVLTAASEAAARAAIGAAPDWTALAVADLTLADGTGTAALADGRVRLTQTADATNWYGYVASVWQAAPGPYAWLAIPAGTREVVALMRVYTGAPAYDYRAAALLLRNGSDVTAAPTAPTPAVASGVKLLGHGLWGHGVSPYGTWDVTYPSGSSLGVAWSPTPGATTRWIGVRWTPGRADAVACDAAGTPTIDNVLVHPASTVVPAWPAPTLLVLSLGRLTGGTAGTSTVDLDFVGWRR